MNLWRKILRMAGSIAVMAGALTFSTSDLHASGFSILEQSTAGLGRSLAGMTCDTYEPSALFFNPSLSAWHDRPILSAGGNWLHVDAYTHNRPGTTADGECGNNGGDWTHVPNFALVYPLTDSFAMGLSFSATSGTATRWNKHWVGRYSSIDCEIAVVEATPSISWKPLDNLSIGMGLLMQYCNCEMKRAVFMNVGDYAFPDGKLKLQGDSLAFGYTLGVTYEPVKGTRLGLGYRSRMTQELELDGELTSSSSFATATGYSRRLKGDADCDLKLPSVTNFGIAQDITDKLTLMADISWTRASQFEKMTVEFEKGSALGEFIHDATGSYSSTEEMKWQDSWRFCIGGEYKLNDKWTLRIGTAYDTTPVRCPEYRSASLPDLNRYWGSMGFSYQWNEHIRLDFGYVKTIFDKDKMKMHTPDGKTAVINCSGDSDIFTYALTYTF